MKIVRSCYHDSYGRTPVVELMREVVNWSETFKDSIVELKGIKKGNPIHRHEWCFVRVFVLCLRAVYMLRLIVS
jgi:hypothetical protein